MPVTVLLSAVGAENHHIAITATGAHMKKGFGFAITRINEPVRAYALYFEPQYCPAFMAARPLCLLHKGRTQCGRTEKRRI